MRHLDLFSGIGGFALAASWCWPEHEVVAFSEIDPFCQQVLKKHWPTVPIIPDVRDVTAEIICELINKKPNTSTKDIERITGLHYAKPVVDLLTAGFPCQPASHAGKRRGTSDDRWLWPNLFRVIQALNPTWCLLENVRGLLTLESGVVFERCCADLESIGYEVQPFVIPACAVGAPHRRDRVWILANAKDAESIGGRGRSDEDTPRGRRTLQVQVARPDRHAADTEGRDTEQPLGGERHNKTRPGWTRPWLEVAAKFCRVDARVPNRVDRLKSLGNAVVVPLVYQIMMAIKSVDNS